MIQIEPWTTGPSTDLEAFVNLMTQLGYPIAIETLAVGATRIADHPDAQILVARATDNGQIVGLAILAIDRLYFDMQAKVELRTLVVDESRRGEGIGQLLVKTSEAWAREQGVDTIFLRSNSIRLEAHRFYKRLGYEEHTKTSKQFSKSL